VNLGTRPSVPSLYSARSRSGTSGFVSQSESVNYSLARTTTPEEDLDFYEAIPDTPDRRRVRVVVYENPYARIPLGRDLFCGPFDERWGVDGEFIQRVLVGSEVAAIEAALGEN
jgi:hypothetical protein